MPRRMHAHTLCQSQQLARPHRVSATASFGVVSTALVRPLERASQAVARGCTAERCRTLRSAKGSKMTKAAQGRPYGLRVPAMCLLARWVSIPGRITRGRHDHCGHSRPRGTARKQTKATPGVLLAQRRQLATCVLTLSQSSYRSFALAWISCHVAIAAGRAGTRSYTIRNGGKM